MDRHFKFVFSLLLLASVVAGFAKDTPKSSEDLVSCILNNDSERLRAFIDAGADVNARVRVGEESIPILLLAVLKQNPAATRLLLAAGAKQYASAHGYTIREFGRRSSNADIRALFGVQ
jgi:hypothetical protein